MRPKGVPNRKTHEFLQKVLGSGKTPLEILLEFAREQPPVAPKLKKKADEAQNAAHAAALAEWETKMLEWRARVREAAKDAAPYCHPRLQASVNPLDFEKPPVQKVEVSFV